MIVSPQGELVNSYKKHFLYEMDKPWAEAGPSFESMELRLPRREAIIKVGLGICMDINPFNFESEFELCEFASFHKEQKSQLIIFSSAWCS